MKNVNILAVVMILTLAACQSPDNETKAEAQKEHATVEIIRDAYGTPHIFAQSNYGVYYGYGYSVAEDRLYQMEMLRRTVLGEVSEVLGDKYLELDKHIRSSYDLPSVRRQFESISSADRVILDAYAEGFSKRVEEVLKNKDALLPLEFKEHDFLPKKWQAYDVAMIFAGAIAHRYSDFNSERDNLALWQNLSKHHGRDKAWHIFSASKWLLDNDSPTTIPSEKSLDLAQDKMPSYLSAIASLGESSRVAVNEAGQYQGITHSEKISTNFKAMLAKNGFASSPEFSPASNYWAVSKAKTSGANGVLVNGPQFGWSLPSYVNGVGLHGGDFDVVGNTLLGLPALLFAHNNKIAWGSTAGLSDQVDEYVLKLNPDNQEQYWHKGTYRDFETWDETITVKGGARHVIKARKASQGMVLSHNDNKLFAVARARAWEGEELATLMAWINLAKQKNIADAKQQVKAVATNINFYYMDTQGNIAYTHAGRYPQRVSGHDSRLPAPGDGQYDWLALRPYSENPTVENPDQGFITNWNNRPSRDWLASDLWPLTWSKADRVQLIIDQLESQERFTPEEVWGINKKISYQDVGLTFLLPHLNKAMESAKLNDIEVSALKMLNEWDQSWLADEDGNYPAEAAIAQSWISIMLKDSLLDDIGEEYFYLYSSTGYPVRQLGASMYAGVGTRALLKNLDALSNAKAPVYDFFNGRAEEAVRQSFQKSIKALTKEQGFTPSAWKIAAPVMQWQGVNFRGVPQASERPEVSIPEYANRGSENNLFIARNEGFEAYDSIPPGQSGFVDLNGKESPHFRDQLSMFSRYEYKKIPSSRDDLLSANHSITKLTLER